MGSFHQFLVATDIALDAAGAKAEAVRNDLVTSNIIVDHGSHRDLASRMTWFNDAVAAREFVCGSERLKDFPHVGNGLGIGVGWQAAFPAEGNLSLLCRGCGYENPLDLAWRAVSTYLGETEPPPITCVLCGHAEGLNDWNTSPPFALGHLALHFDDWPPLTPDAIRYLRSLLGGRVIYVTQRQ